MERPTATKKRLWWSWMAGSPTRMPLKPHRTDNRRLTTMMELALDGTLAVTFKKRKNRWGNVHVGHVRSLHTWVSKVRRHPSSANGPSRSVNRSILLSSRYISVSPRLDAAARSGTAETASFRRNLEISFTSQICSELIPQNLPLVNGHLSCWCDCVLARRTWHKYPTNPTLNWAWRATWPPSNASCKIFKPRASGSSPTATIAASQEKTFFCAADDASIEEQRCWTPSTGGCGN